MISYDVNQLAKLNTWDSEAYPIYIFETMKFLDINTKNLSTSLLYMANFIRNRSLKRNTEKDIPQLGGFGQGT